MSYDSFRQDQQKMPDYVFRPNKLDKYTSINPYGHKKGNWPKRAKKKLGRACACVWCVCKCVLPEARGCLTDADLIVPNQCGARIVRSTETGPVRSRFCGSWIANLSVVIVVVGIWSKGLFLWPCDIYSVSTE